jgi:hypothetical protein
MMASIEIVAYKPNMEVVFFGSALSLLFRQAQSVPQAESPDIYFNEMNRGKLFSHSAFV